MAGTQEDAHMWHISRETSQNAPVGVMIPVAYESL